MSHRQAKRARQEARRERQTGLATRRSTTERGGFLGSLSHRRKLTWAKFHIDEAERLIKGWVDDGGYRVFQEFDDKGGVRLMAEMLQPLPDEMSLVIGDALQNLRNSLDNLAFALAGANTPGMMPQEERMVSFPVSDSAVALTDRRISLMSSAVQRAICDLAPDPARGPLDQNPLWLLNKAANRDKHREITAIAAAYGVQDFSISGGYISHMRTNRQPLRLGERPKPILEISAGTHVRMHMRHRLLIGFGQGIEVANREIVPTLRTFHDHIRDVVFKRLEPYL